MNPTEEKLERYYAWHARVYDLSRWSFLFGRGRLLDRLAERHEPRSILEVGCGTGVNLERLARRFPRAQLRGIDASEAMLDVAERRLASTGSDVELTTGYYQAPMHWDPAPDLILFSYCLSMANPGVEEVVRAAVADLAPGGRLAVVDFHATRHRWFGSWMQLNHVRMEGHLLPLLRSRMPEEYGEVRPAYGRAWEYFLWISDVRRAGGGEAVHEPPRRFAPRPAELHL